MRRRQSYYIKDDLQVMAMETPITFNNIPEVVKSEVIKSYSFTKPNTTCMCSAKLIQLAGHKKNCKEGHTRNRPKT